MLEHIINADKDLFLYLNGIHNPFWDTIMYYVTKTSTWIPFYVLLAAFVVKKFRKNSWPVFIGVALVILIADQTASGFMKGYFERLRPCHDPIIGPLVHLVKGCGGKYGFVSSHASNTFGLATFMYLIFPQERKLFRWMFLWAAIVAYSRIYVGVHYPLDILGGAWVGVVAGVIGIVVTKLILKKITKSKYGL
ncbi:hypothetical protein FUAX_13350 [Fulvitalea axinellae]|uniref:Phosphatidic acid phosphatase type 2/haloperoxidase domain-containing protein n=1 Tax=Fulvitalea axinellae TaxID=1182444 RepID=A0AAU9CZ11_9BACT|nr:hypothetical protein FUAX_13350 [Fulvitalea axinellae]